MLDGLSFSGCRVHGLRTLFGVIGVTFEVIWEVLGVIWCTCGSTSCTGALGTPFGSPQEVQHGPNHDLMSHLGAARWKKWYPWAYKGGQSVVNNGVLSMFTK